jgi:hypothetical protein
MRWYDRQATIEDITLVAWHHMINDPLISVYTFENDQEKRQLINPNIAPKPKWYEGA